MLNRFAALGALMLIPVGTAQVAWAQPPVQDPGPPPDNGVVASAEPGIVTTPTAGC